MVRRDECVSGGGAGHGRYNFSKLCIWDGCSARQNVNEKKILEKKKTQIWCKVVGFG